MQQCMNCIATRNRDSACILRGVGVISFEMARSCIMPKVMPYQKCSLYVLRVVVRWVGSLCVVQKCYASSLETLRMSTVVVVSVGSR